MKVSKLTKPGKFINTLRQVLKPYGITVYGVSYPSNSSVKFRAERVFHKPYAGGGMIDGKPFSVHASLKQAKSLHWEEWALVNHSINRICDEYELFGQCKSWFRSESGEGMEVYIRKNGNVEWDITHKIKDIRLELKSEFTAHYKANGTTPNKLFNVASY